MLVPERSGDYRFRHVAVVIETAGNLNWILRRWNTR
jgi:hypothetical protein